MSYSSSEIAAPDRSHFRCPVVGEKGKATLRVGFTKIHATVVEASVSGYTITVKAKYAKRLARSKRDWLISYDETKVIVRAQWFSEPQDGLVRIGLHQVKDLTKPEKMKGYSLWTRLKPSFGDSDTATVAYGGFVLFLFAALSMPGLGDRLGTSNRIQNTVRWVLDTTDQQVEMWSR